MNFVNIDDVCYQFIPTEIEKHVDVWGYVVFSKNDKELQKFNINDIYDNEIDGWTEERIY